MAVVRPTAPERRPRDLRIDFFRGLALLVIFIDHIPNNVVSRFTIRNFAFCDAAELFIFICGYSGAYVFCSRRKQKGTLAAILEHYRRVWILYVVHLFMFMFFMAQVFFAVSSLGNVNYLFDMNMNEIMTDPQATIAHAFTLQFQPRFLDILPLYIVLLSILPLCLMLPWGLSWNVGMISLGVYLIVQATGLPMPAYPPGAQWFFNPFAWQLLFCIGALAGRATALGRVFVRYRRSLFWAAAAYAAVAGVASISWTVADVWPGSPVLLASLQSMDKTTLSSWRLINFLALAYLAVQLMPRDMPLLSTWLGRLMIDCGRHSLDLFCLGILLSFLAFIEIDTHGHRVWLQVALSVGGAGVLILFAKLLDLYARVTRGVAVEAPAVTPAQ